MWNFKEQGGAKSQCFNIEQLRRVLREPKSPSKTIQTTNQIQFQNLRGSGLVGSDKYETIGLNQRCKTREKKSSVFKQMATSSYKSQYQPIFGLLPEANVRPQVPFESGNFRFKGETEANL